MFILFSLIGALGVITVIHISFVLYRFDSPNPNILILVFFKIWNILSVDMTNVS